MIIRHWFARFLVLLFIVFGLTLVGLRYTLTPLLNHLASSQLQKLGLDHIAFDVSEISLRQVVVSGIEIGSDKSLEIPELKASFLWSDLISGRVEQVNFSDVRVRVQVVGDRLSFGALDPLLVGNPGNQEIPGGELGLPDWPVKQVNINSAIVEIGSVFGLMKVPFSGVIRQREDFSVSLEEAEFGLVREDIKIEGELSAVLTPEGAVETTVTLEHGFAAFGDLSATFGGGAVHLVGNLNDLENFSADSKLSLLDSQLPFGAKAKADMSVSLKQGDAAVRFDVFETQSDTHAKVRTEVSGVFSENPHVSVSVDASSKDISKITNIVALPLPLQGATDFHLETAMSLHSMIDLSQMTGSAAVVAAIPDVNIRFSGQSLATSEIDALGVIEGELNVRSRNGRIELTSPGKIRANLTGGILQPLISGAEPYLNADFSEIAVTLSPQIHLSPGPTIDQINFSTKADWQVAAGEMLSASGHLAADSMVSLTAQQAPEVNVRVFSLEANNLSLKHGGKVGLRLTADAKGQGQEFEGHTTIKLKGADLENDGIRVDRLGLDMELAFSAEPNGGMVFLKGCHPFKITGLKLVPQVEPLKNLEGCVHQTGIPALSISSEGEAGFDLGVKLGAKEIELKVEGAPDVLFNPDGVAVRAAGIVKDAETFSADVEISGGEILVPEHNLTVLGLGASLYYNTFDPDFPLADVRANVNTVHYETEDNLVPPLSVSIEARQTEDENTFSLGIRDRKGLIRADIDGTFDLDAKIVEAALRVPPISLGPKARKVEDYLPIAGEWVKNAKGLGFLAGKAEWDEDEGLRADLDVLFRAVRAKVRVPGETAPLKVEAGQLGVSLRATLKEDQITSSAELLAENVNASMEDLAVNGLNSLISLDNVWPPRTAEPQQISITEVLAGLPLNNGAMTVEIDGIEKIRIDDVSFELANGKMTADPVEIIDGNIPPSKIKVEGLDLEELVKLIDAAGVVARGKLNGVIPVAFREQDVFVEDAVLEAEPGGMIGYLPDGPPSEKDKQQGNELKILELDYTEFMLGALTNFKYDQLKVNLNGRGRGDMRVRMDLKGHNPDFFTGHPVELKVGVNGRLMDILRTGVNNYEVPENIRQRMLGFGR
jgi:hypothetical protein